VKWGEQTWEEMLIGYFEGVFLNQDLSQTEPRITSLSSDTFRVHFTYRPNRPVRSVAVAGTFNEWNTWSHPLKDTDGDGVFDTDVQLPKGPHRYKFVVDGNYWTHDPASRILTGFFHESFFVAGNQSKRAGETKP
jgi:1,4-alpha-glucan branching enzyme